jgi:hydrogenase-4 component B
MSALTSPLALELAAAAVLGLSGVPGCLRPHSRAAGPGAASALNALGSALGLAGVALHLRTGDAQTAVLGTLPIGRVAFGLDALAALFLVPIFLVSALGSLYGASYWTGAERAASGRRLRLAWGVMTASMAGVVLAADAVLFLVAWELMAVAAFFLIGTEEERPEVRRAAWVYLVATHAGTLCLIGFFALLGSAQGSFALWPRLDAAGASGVGTALFALGLLGFGLKAGLVPLHVWLPGAHASAPSHVSALLSGVLLKAGVYGLVRVCALLPEPPAWWGGVLLAAGAATGVLGIALAAAQQDLKRLLAYSSIENVGVVAIGVGLAALGRSSGRPDLVALGLGGALLHVLNHSLMKPLLFFAAGGVLHATGTRQLSSLGGLARAMPRTFAIFVLGAAAICGLPPLNGFASELLLYLGLLRAAAPDGPQGLAWAGLAAPALALTGALALASFVKVAGIAFAGAPRSPAAAAAHDPGPGMLGPMAALALGCLLLGLLPGAAVPLLQRAVAVWDPAAGAAAPRLAALAPFGRVSAAGIALAAALGLGAAALRRRPSRRPPALTWDCGYARPTPRMQYVGASFSETLVGLFDWAVRSRRTPPALGGPFPGAARFESDVPDAVLDGVVLPLAGAGDRALARVRVLQRGPVQMYLLYVLLAVVVLLVVAR